MQPLCVQLGVVCKFVVLHLMVLTVVSNGGSVSPGVASEWELGVWESLGVVCLHMEAPYMHIWQLFFLDWLQLG